MTRRSGSLPERRVRVVGTRATIVVGRISEAELARTSSLWQRFPEMRVSVKHSRSQPDGSWVFTDDRGITVTLPGMPKRIIADVNVAAALWDFGVRPVGLFGWNITGE